MRLAHSSSGLVMVAAALAVASTSCAGAGAHRSPPLRSTAAATVAPPSRSPAAVPALKARRYPLHTSIVSTTFWVGEVFDATVADGSQLCSTYDSQWAYHYSGIRAGRIRRDAAACPGAITGGCDGTTVGGSCDPQPRTAGNGYFPTGFRPLQNPFYLDLPYDDLNDPVGFSERCRVIPWAADPGYAGHCSDRAFSYLKNRWVEVTGPSGRTCYGQNEDAGPSHDSLYHDAPYVFGGTNARPTQTRFNHAGMDVSPAMNACLGFHDRNGDQDRIGWRFVEAAAVRAGPWTTVITTTPVTD